MCPPFLTTIQCVCECCGMHYPLWTPWKALFYFPNDKCFKHKWIVGMKREQWILSNNLKFLATTPSLISSCKSATLFCLFICCSKRKPARGPLHPDCVLSVFPHTIQIANTIPEIIIYAPSRCLLREHSKSPL